LCSLSLLSGSGAGKFSVRALVRPDDTDDADSVGDGSLAFPNHVSVKIPFGNREVISSKSCTLLISLVASLNSELIGRI